MGLYNLKWFTESYFGMIHQFNKWRGSLYYIKKVDINKFGYCKKPFPNWILTFPTTVKIGS